MTSKIEAAVKRAEFGLAPRLVLEADRSLTGAALPDYRTVDEISGRPVFDEYRATG